MLRQAFIVFEGRLKADLISCNKANFEDFAETIRSSFSRPSFSRPSKKGFSTTGFTAFTQNICLPITNSFRKGRWHIRPCVIFGMGYLTG